MSEPEYISDAIPGFDVWRDPTAAGMWRGRHSASGRTVSAGTWELLVWRAYEVRILISIADVSKALSSEPTGS
jgi:hypothetical protein